MKQDFYFPSKDGTTSIHGIEWIPEGNVKAVLQICHGMVEHIARYHEFAEYLCDRGYYVVGHDHLGHGESVTNENHLGFFHKTQGNFFLISDIHAIRKKTMQKYPELPYFMLGHSMGSFLLRQYIKKAGIGLAGVMILGTAYYPRPVLQMGRVLCKMIAVKNGWNYRSSLMNRLAYGGYNRKFFPARTEVDWITKDKQVIDDYLKDEWCTFMFTVNGYYHMFGGMRYLNKKGNIARIPKSLPVLFASGEEDPVGGFGKGVEKVFQNYKSSGLTDASLKLYPNDRHEILNETDRDIVYSDLFQWMEDRWYR